MKSKLTLSILMLAIAITSFPVLRSSLSASSIFARFPYRKPVQDVSTRALSSTAPTVRQQHTRVIDTHMAAGTTDGQLPPSTMPTADSVADKPVQPELPKLSAAEFQIYNKMAVMMEYYHNHFRATWTTLYTACEQNRRPSGMSISQFTNLGLQFISHLTVHHDIEETHIFPVLARKMPEFQPRSTMVTQHVAIHDGLERLEQYLKEVRRGERELRLKGDGEGSGSLKEVMDSFGKVLWTHLDAEVKNLGAENMRRYWTTAEMGKFNF